MKGWFCAAVATVAAAIADPLVESASNAGWFGPGRFTDHSTWDVIPVLTIGLVLAAFHVWARVRRALARDHVPGPRSKECWQLQTSVRLLPIIFGLQMAVLFAMETIEQRVVHGTLYGGTVWLGGPVAVSLTVHAATCILVTLLATMLIRVFTRRTLQLVHMIEALARIAPTASSVFYRRIQLLPCLAAADVAQVQLGRGPPAR
ncbi:MAG TPA: hypothetical protein VEJ41_10125 [Candidatus Acidoferrales bacterium]|nr:hypothetical protein [Candidatus Acidoferrales bacterium]